MKRLVPLLLTVSAFAPTSARAELWNALDTVPKPNAVVGYDTSVTMRIDVGCNSCHRRGMPAHRERVAIARRDLLATMPLFEDYFVFGGFEYQGCGAASIRARTLPNVADPEASFNATRNLLMNARGCNSSEDRYPSGSRTRCITPTSLCMGDPPVAEAILRGGLPGLRLPPLPTNTSTVCGNPARTSPTFDLEGFLIAQTAGMQWPRWGGHITGRHVQEDLCDPLYGVLAAARTALNRCLVDPQAYWDLSSISGGPAGWCVPGTIAGAACSSSPFVGTCVCNGGQPGCQTTYGLPRSECGQPLTWKARQQVAVCEAYDPATFGGAFASQPDNRINVGGCRENVAMFFTDGYQGQRPGVQYEAVAAQTTYGSASGQPNMFVFRVSNSFRGAADRMMRYVSNNEISQAFSATDDRRMRSSFSQVLARIYRGDYAGSAPAISFSGDRVAISSFTVPGYTAGAPVSDTYIGWPMSVALHAIQEDGSIDPDPLFRTDWASRVGASSSCGYHELGSLDVGLLGPGGQFDNGISREVHVPTGALGDRDSDGDAEPDRPLRWGRFYGFGAGKPIIVEAPNEVPNPEWAVEWVDHVDDYADRPRMVYAMGGGYVLGFHGGDEDGTGTYGGLRQNHVYDDGAPQAGTEVLRYRPSWLRPGGQAGHNPRYDVSLNPMVPQRLTTGEMVAREVFDGTEFRTLLVGAQGKEGSGYFALDVTDPCAPRVLSEWLLPPGAYASARPEVYYLPQLSAPHQRPAVVTTGGLEGLPLLLAYDVRNGNELSRIGLPTAPDTSYPSAPVCVDVTGEGSITHCYAVRSDGLLARVEVDLDGHGFSGVEDVTPVDGGSPVSIGGGRVFSTEPAVFFDGEGQVNLVFGSGSHEDLTVAGPRNYVYKVVDEATRRQGMPSAPTTVSGACAADSGGDTAGVFPLPPGDRLVSPPVVSDGVVAWTAYHTSSSGCVAGTSDLYAMRYDTCEDALGNGTDRPQPVPAGEGIPTSPVLHPVSGTLLTRTSAGGSSAGVGAFTADTSGPGRPWARKLYWRYELDVR